MSIFHKSPMFLNENPYINPNREASRVEPPVRETTLQVQSNPEPGSLSSEGCLGGQVTVKERICGFLFHPKGKYAGHLSLWGEKGSAFPHLEHSPSQTSFDIDRVLGE